MADFAVDGVNTVSGHFDDAAQMRIGPPHDRAVAASLGFVGSTEAHIGRRHQGRSHRAGDCGEIGAAPKRVPTVVGVELILHLPRDRLIFGQFRAAFDLGPRQRDNELSPFEVLSRNGRRMDEHLAPCQPGPAIDDEPAHFPRRIVEQKIDDSSDPAVARLDREAFQRGNDLQHGSAPHANGSVGKVVSQFDISADASLPGCASQPGSSVSIEGPTGRSTLFRAYETQTLFVERLHNIPHHFRDFGCGLR